MGIYTGFIMRQPLQVGQYFIKPFSLADRQRVVRLANKFGEDEYGFIADVLVKYITDELGNPFFKCVADVFLMDAIEIEKLYFEFMEFNKQPTPATSKEIPAIPTSTKDKTPKT